MGDNEETYADIIIAAIGNYIDRKRKWFKAFEVLRDFLLEIDQSRPGKEQEIFKF